MIHDRIETLNNLTKSYTDLSRQLEINVKPNPESWSFGEILNHLNTVNESYFETFERLVDGKHVSPFWGKFGWIPRFIGNEILKATHPSNEKKITTFSIWEPDKFDEKIILSDFENHQRTLIDHLLQLEKSGLLQVNPIIRSPANKFIIYELNTAIDIIIAHESRHLKQAMGLDEKVPANG